MQRLDGQVVFLTGAAGGIGSLVAARLRAEGDTHQPTLQFALTALRMLDIKAEKDPHGNLAVVGMNLMRFARCHRGDKKSVTGLSEFYTTARESVSWDAGSILQRSTAEAETLPSFR